MSTQCSYCQTKIEEKPNETYQLCKHCNRFTPTNNIKEEKGGLNEMVESKSKFADLNIKIIELIKAGKSAKEIKAELGENGCGMPKIKRMIKANSQ